MAGTGWWQGQRRLVPRGPAAADDCVKWIWEGPAQRFLGKAKTHPRREGLGADAVGGQVCPMKGKGTMCALLGECPQHSWVCVRLCVCLCVCVCVSVCLCARAGKPMGVICGVCWKIKLIFQPSWGLGRGTDCAAPALPAVLG